MSGALTADDLAYLDAAYAKMTPGEWQWFKVETPTPEHARREAMSAVDGTERAGVFSGEMHMAGVPHPETGGTLYTAVSGCGPDGAANAEGIVAIMRAWPHIRTMLDELATLRAALAPTPPTSTED